MMYFILSRDAKHRESKDAPPPPPGYDIGGPPSTGPAIGIGGIGFGFGFGHHKP